MIRQEMMTNFRHGGKRCGFIWFKRWFYSGHGFLSVILYIGSIVLGFQGLIAKDLTYLIIYVACYFPIATTIGFFWYWCDFVTLDVHAGNIMNPFVHDVNDALKIRRKS